MEDRVVEVLLGGEAGASYKPDDPQRLSGDGEVEGKRQPGYLFDAALQMVIRPDRQDQPQDSLDRTCPRRADIGLSQI
jgi:hypothetical protein